jgi:hypothetical protein
MGNNKWKKSFTLRSWLATVVMMLGALGFGDVALATSNVNQISCTYFQNASGVGTGTWENGVGSAFAESFELRPGEGQFVGAIWTNTEGTMANGFCTLIRGTESEQSIIVENYIYRGRRIGTVVESDCYAIGDDVVLVRVDQRHLNRGEFLESVLSWEPPQTPNFKLKVYFPTIKETQNIGLTLESKCNLLN